MWGANSISAFTYTNADGKQVGMWWILFVIYFIVGILGYVLLAFDKIEEPAPDAGTTTIGRCFKLLFSDRIVLLCFLGIVAHVGVDVAINAQAPRILTEHTGDTFTAIASSATMVYFVARMIGCFTGGIVLQKISNKLGVRICGVIMTLLRHLLRDLHARGRPIRRSGCSGSRSHSSASATRTCSRCSSPTRSCTVQTVRTRSPA